MALASTLFRFRVELSDVERSLYRAFDLRMAKHPSENEVYLVTRLLAYLLSFEEGLEFAPGLCTDDEPAIFLRDPGSGGFTRWIEIGNPSARRLHKASKAARSVQIYTYKDLGALVRELSGEKIHRRESIEAFALDPKFLGHLVSTLGRDNTWAVFRQDGTLTVAIGADGEQSFDGLLEAVALGE
jgi:uncharacterized protein YaeQ